MKKTHNFPPPTLLEAARASVKKREAKEYTDEQIELALAWVAGEVTISQMARVLGYSQPAAVYPFLALALRQYLSSDKD